MRKLAKSFHEEHTSRIGGGVFGPAGRGAVILKVNGSPAGP